MAVILLALAFLIIAAYRGFSVILFAPLAALLAILFTEPALALPLYGTVFMEKLTSFIKLFFPVFMLSAVFGKLTEVSGMAAAIARSVISFFGSRRAIPAVVAVCAILTYGGVSLFVVAFSVYPFAAGLFRSATIPKRFLPATVALGAFTFTMDAFPGTTQIQNIIPTSAFHTTAWAAPLLGLAGGIFILATGLWYLQLRAAKAMARGEGYGDRHLNEPDKIPESDLPPVWQAVIPLLLVVVLNRVLMSWLTGRYGSPVNPRDFGFDLPASPDLNPFLAVWSVCLALTAGIASIIAFRFRSVRNKIRQDINSSIGGALLAVMNTASEYGFGAMIAVLPGFRALQRGMAASFQNVLINEAVTVTTLSGVTGSASGGLSIALASMKDEFLSKAAEQKVPREVLHRIASMASGGMDTLPHNSAILTLLIITGMTHREAYRDIFILTILKVAAAFFAIALYEWFGLV